MEVGKYYRVDDIEDDWWMIGKVTEVGELEDDGNWRGEALTINSNKYFESSGWCYKSEDGSRDYREATPSEIAWLDECIKQNKYVEESEVINSNYEIY